MGCTHCLPASSTTAKGFVTRSRDKHAAVSGQIQIEHGFGVVLKHLGAGPGGDVPNVNVP